MSQTNQKFYEPAKDANWHQRNTDKIAAFNKYVREQKTARQLDAMYRGITGAAR